MNRTKIEWAEATWNPITGCTPISEGCAHCYAQRMATRLAGRCGYPADEPFRVTVHPKRIDEPLHWKKPRRIFVCSMGDLFHDDVPYELIREVHWRIQMNPRHTFMVLTKRPSRMLEWYRSNHAKGAPVLANLWIGVTAESQQRANERIPLLLQTPAAVRFVSVEPMLGSMDLEAVEGFEHDGIANTLDGCGCNKYGLLSRMCTPLDLVVCGAETGPGARPMKLEWARSLRDQCSATGVPFFMKKVSGGGPLPDDLNIRQWPG